MEGIYMNYHLEKKPILRAFHTDIAFEHYVLTEGFVFERFYINGIIKIICKLRNPNEPKTKNRKIVI